MKLEITSKIMQQIQGVNFVVIGPFLVANIGQNQKIFANLEVGEHGMESVMYGYKTESHEHNFLSFYKSDNLDVVCRGEKFELPQFALTLVPPQVDHSWTPKHHKSKGSVGSLDIEHVKQVIQLAV